MDAKYPITQPRRSKVILNLDLWVSKKKCTTMPNWGASKGTIKYSRIDTTQPLQKHWNFLYDAYINRKLFKKPMNYSQHQRVKYYPFKPPKTGKRFGSVYRHRRGRAGYRAKQFRWGGVQMLEKKSTVIAAVSPMVASTVAVLLNSVDQGTDFDQRIGNVITIQSISMNIEVFPQTPTPTGILRNLGRIKLIWDKQPNGVLATFADINELSTSPQSFVNLDNRERFKTIWNSGLFTITDNTGSIQYHRSWDVFVPASLVVQYSAVGTGIGAISTGALLLFFQIDTVTTTEYTFNVRTRIRFVDGKGANKHHTGRLSVKST